MSMLLRRYHTVPAESESKPVVEEKPETVKEMPKETPEQAEVVEKKKGGRPKKNQ